MNIFKYLNYRDYLRARIHEDGRSQKGYQTRLALAAGCQKSMISRVLSGELHFTLDHAYGLCEFWDLKEVEQLYFLTLVEYERAGNSKYRAYLKAKLAKLKEDDEDLSRRYLDKQNALNDSFVSEYYSSWHYPAIHFLTSIPYFQHEERLAEHLGLNIIFVKNILRRLQEMGLCRREASTWKCVNFNIHLSKESPLLAHYHRTWRTVAIDEYSFGKNKKNIHYTALHTLSKKDFEQIRQMVLDFIEKSRAVVAPSPEEILIGINFDLYEIGRNSEI